MENNLNKIYTNKAISIATFFGGPLAAGILISKNYKVFGDDEAARKSVFVGVLSTFLIFIGIILLPDNIIEKIPQSLIPGIYTAIIAFLVHNLQGNKINEFLSENGQKASNWQTAGYGLFGLLIIVAFLFVLSYAIPFKGFEKRITVDNNITLHYSKNIEKSKSEQIAWAIKQSGFMDGSEGADIFLNTEKSFYRLKFIIPEKSLFSDKKFLTEFNEFENYLNFNLNLDKRIEIGFTDASLKNSIELIKMATNNMHIYEPMLYLQKYQINNFHTIFYNSSMSIEDVKKVEGAIKKLKGYFPPYNHIDIIFINTTPDYTIKFFVLKDFWYDQGVTNRLRSTIDYIKDNGINKKINLVLIDNQTFEEIKL